MMRGVPTTGQERTRQVRGPQARGYASGEGAAGKEDAHQVPLQVRGTH